MNWNEIIGSAIAALNQESYDGDLDNTMPPPQNTLKEAGVLMLIDLSDEPKLWLTQRSTNIREHAGQVSFPGGKKDPSDLSLYETARREAEEEINFKRDYPVTKLGVLPIHTTISNYAMNTFAVSVNNAPSLSPNPDEVAHIFALPLSQLIPENFLKKSFDFEGGRRHYYEFNYNGFRIWGATARILQSLSMSIENVRNS